MKVQIPPKIDDDLRADYIELNVLVERDSDLSTRDIASQVVRDEEEDESQAGDDDIDGPVGDAWQILGERLRMTSKHNAYPFELSENGNKIRSQLSDRSWLYVFCLVATLADMRKDTVGEDQEKLVGADLFEEVCGQALSGWCNGLTSHNVFSGGATLESRINAFRKEFDEGGSFSNNYSNARSGDGKSDIVAWLPHTDARPGKLTVFCQCKTGSSWRRHQDYVPRPEVWSSSYFTSPPFQVKAVPCIMVSSSLDESLYKELALKQGLLTFDRQRISTQVDGITQELGDRCREWTRQMAEREWNISIGI